MEINAQHQVAIEANAWEGTRFKHQGRIKRHGKDAGGVDCIGLIVGVCHELQLTTRDAHGNLVPLSSYDRPNYAREPNKEQLKEALERFCVPVEEGRLFQPGDILLFTFARWPQHAGIITHVDADAEDIHFVHASQPVGKVIKSRLDYRWRRHLVGVYRFPASAFEGAAWHK